MALHTSAPLSEEIKVTLKVSQNLHASMTAPYLIGVYAVEPKGEAKADLVTAGFKAEHDMLQAAGLDLSGAVQSDGAGADAFYYAGLYGALSHFPLAAKLRGNFPFGTSCTWQGRLTCRSSEGLLPQRVMSSPRPARMSYPTCSITT